MTLNSWIEGEWYAVLREVPVLVILMICVDKRHISLNCGFLRTICFTSGVKIAIFLYLSRHSCNSFKASSVKTNGLGKKQKKKKKTRLLVYPESRSAKICLILGFLPNFTRSSWNRWFRAWAARLLVVILSFNRECYITELEWCDSALFENFIYILDGVKLNDNTPLYELWRK